MKKNRCLSAQLLLAQAIAVFIWFLITVVQWTNSPNNSPGLTIPLIVRAVEAFSVLLVSGLLIFIINKAWHLLRRTISKILLFVAFYFFAVAANIISLAIRGLIGYAPPKIDGYFFIQSLHFYIPLYLVVAVYYVVRHRIELRTEREDKLKAEGLAQQAKWMMLRYQVNPHFLFNTLNSIRALIGNDDEKARKIITDMSEYFRYSLSIDKKSLVSVKEEIGAVVNYLEIQKTRYPERLRIEKTIDNKILNCLIPVFSIQTLVENAVKYGLKTHDGIVKIEIGVTHNQNKLCIKISNTGKLVKHTLDKNNLEGTNTGIKNLKDRLKYLDSDFQFKLIEDDGKVIASVSINICKKYEDLEDSYS